MDKSMIDGASGGALVDLTPDVVKNLISNMAANSQQFGTEMDHTLKRVNEVSISSLEQRVEELTSLVQPFYCRKPTASEVMGHLFKHRP